MFFKIGLADDIVLNGNFVGKITTQNANKWRNDMTEYLFAVDNLLKRRRLRYYIFLLRYTNGLT